MAAVAAAAWLDARAMRVAAEKQHRQRHAAARLAQRHTLLLFHQLMDCSAINACTVGTLIPMGDGEWRTGEASYCSSC